MAKEKQFENRVKKFLKENNTYFFKYWGGGEFTKAGIPDLICCCSGFFLGIEVKAERGKPSLLQIVNLRKIDESGGFGILLYPNQYDVFTEFIYYLKKNDFIGVQKTYEILKLRWKEWEYKYDE